MKRFVTHLKQENYVELATNKSKKKKLSTDIWPFSAACRGFSVGHLPTLLLVGEHFRTVSRTAIKHCIELQQTWVP